MDPRNKSAGDEEWGGKVLELTRSISTRCHPLELLRRDGGDVFVSQFDLFDNRRNNIDA